MQSVIIIIITVPFINGWYSQNYTIADFRLFVVEYKYSSYEYSLVGRI